MTARKSVKAWRASFWVWAAVAAILASSLGSAGCRSTKSSGGDSCESGCSGH